MSRAAATAETTADDRAAHERDDHDHQQVQEDLRVERELVVQRLEQQGEQRQRHQPPMPCRSSCRLPAQPELAGDPARHRVVEQVLAADVRDLGAHLRTQGTLVTVTDGSNSSLPFSRSAVWLWSRFCHQCSTTYSGMTTETTSPGCSRSSWWT